MSVSAVIPALGDRLLLEQCLQPLLRELERRGGDDEVVVVDDGGEGALGAWLRAHHPSVRCVASERNQGFARALSAGIDAARHEHVLALNSDVRVRRGFLEPLEAALEDPRVFAAVPRILLQGREGEVESLVVVRLEGGIARAAQPLLERASGERIPPDWRTEDGLRTRRPVPFPIGGACLFARAAFRELGGFDPRFEPFYLEDLDLGWRAWKRGLQCHYVGSSVVEHQHRGTIGALVPEGVVRTAIERNRLAFTWKHLDDPKLLAEHLELLERRICEARIDGDRTFLEALCLALEDRAASGAEPASAQAPSWTAILNASDPFVTP